MITCFNVAYLFLHMIFTNDIIYKENCQTISKGDKLGNYCIINKLIKGY